jgi:acetate kinase
MKILVANLGSTSLKYQLFDCEERREATLARGAFERVTDYGEAIEGCLGQLARDGFVGHGERLGAVGFKTVLGRDVTGCVEVDDRVIAALEAASGIAPAHNPPYVRGLREFAERMPGIPLVALFETAFFEWVPAAARQYAVPEAWRNAGVRRAGFHGASHKFIAERSAELCGRDDVAERVRRLYVDQGASPVRSPELRVISCHLGGSSSVVGIRNGVAVGSSMGMSPQSGLPQNNRVGDLDAMAIPHVMRTLGLGLDEVERTLAAESGLFGLSGGHRDLRDIRRESERGDARARLALDVLVHQTRHWVGAFFLELNGVDALVFTAGIGEKDPAIRAAVCAGLDRLGIELDPDANALAAGAGTEVVVSPPDSPVKVLVIPTNEELVVAREVKRFLSTRPRAA